jgi:hypothetical protein
MTRRGAKDTKGEWGAERGPLSTTTVAPLLRHRRYRGFFGGEWGSRKDGGRGGRRGGGIAECAEGNEGAERGFSDLRVSVGSVVQRTRRLMGWCMGCMS